MADAYNRAIGKVSFRGLLDALSPTPIVGDAISGVLGLYDTGKGLLGDYKAAQEKDPRKMIRGMAANTDNYNSGLLNAASVLPYVTPAVAGMFIGKNSKVWDALKADEAQKMLAAGVDPKEVWKKTGTFKGVDGALRQEIDDSASKVTRTLSTLKGGGSDGFPVEHLTYAKRPDGYDISMKKVGAKTTDDFFQINAADDSVVRGALPDDIANRVLSGASDEPSFIGSDFLDANQLNSRFQFDGFNAIPVQNAIDHKPLMNAYNFDEYVKVNPKLGIGGSLAKIDTGDSVITTGLGDQRGTLLHELQHAIQEREGWARGGNVDEMAGYVLPQQQKALDEFSEVEKLVKERGLEFKPISSLSGEDAALKKKYTELMTTIQLDKPNPYNAYRQLAGEAEARLTQSRMNMTMPERLQVYPYDMLDVPQDQLIVRGLLGN